MAKLPVQASHGNPSACGQCSPLGSPLGFIQTAHPKLHPQNKAGHTYLGKASLNDPSTTHETPCHMHLETSLVSWTLDHRSTPWPACSRHHHGLLQRTGTNYPKASALVNQVFQVWGENHNRALVHVCLTVEVLDLIPNGVFHIHCNQSRAL